MMLDPRTTALRSTTHLGITRAAGDGLIPAWWRTRGDHRRTFVFHVELGIDDGILERLDLTSKCLALHCPRRQPISRVLRLHSQPFNRSLRLQGALLLDQLALADRSHLINLRLHLLHQRPTLRQHPHLHLAHSVKHILESVGAQWGLPGPMRSPTPLEVPGPIAPLEVGGAPKESKCKHTRNGTQGRPDLVLNRIPLYPINTLPLDAAWGGWRLSTRCGHGWYGGGCRTMRHACMQDLLLARNGSSADQLGAAPSFPCLFLGSPTDRRDVRHRHCAGRPLQGPAHRTKPIGHVLLRVEFDHILIGLVPTFGLNMLIADK